MAVMFLLTTMLGAAPLQAAAAVNDINGHWAQSQVQSLIDRGVVAGYPDNTFRPNNTITRAEFFTMTNRAFSYSATAPINYTDVPSDAWFVTEIAKAKAAGYIAGYEDGTMRPNAEISRQEVAAILAVIMKLDSSDESALSAFTDGAAIPAWSRGYIAAMVKAGYIAGYPDKSFKAQNAISRAESTVILARTLGVPTIPVVPTIPTVYDKSGTYGPADSTQTIDGNVTISAAGVVLQNTTIKGDLLVAQSVGEGNVNFKNVTVTGTTTIKGGGVNSVTFDRCIIKLLIVNKTTGKVRVVFLNASQISQLQVDTASRIVGDGIAAASINTNGVIIESTPGSTKVAPGKTAMVGGKTMAGTPVFSGGGGGGGGGGTPNIPVTGVTIDKANLILVPGQEAYLKDNVHVQPSNATNQKLLWSSNHPGAADVDQNGKVTAVAKGQATITAETVDRGLTLINLT